MCPVSLYCNLSLSVTTGLAFRTGDFVQLYCDNCNYIIGQVVSYDSGTGAMVITPYSFEGTGTCCNWTVRLTGAPGMNGTSGINGGTGTAGTSGIINGTLNYVAKFTPDGTSVGDSIIYNGVTNVGIGTNTPGYKLEVNGTGKFSDVITIEAGAANAITMQSSIGTNTVYQRFINSGGNYYIGVDSSVGTSLFSSGGIAYALSIVTESARPIILGTNNTANLTIASGGAATFSSTLTVGGTISLSGNSNTFVVGSIFRNTNRVFFGGDTGGFYWQNSGNTATILQLNDAGNLGLGVTPSAWIGVYNVFQFGETGALSSTNNNTRRIRLSNNTYINTSGVETFIEDGASHIYIQDSGGHSWFNSTTSGTAGNAITFTQAMTLNASGQLSVGTTSTQSGTRLLVAGVTDIWSSTNTLLRLAHNGTIGIIETFTGGAYGPTTINRDGGNVLIGTTTDSGEKLQVNGTGRFSSSVTASVRLKGNSTTGLDLQNDSGGGYIWNRDNTSLYFATNNIQRLEIASTGAATFSNLAGTGTRMVVADATGLLSTQTIPSGAGAAGTSGQVQFNSSGSFGADSNFFWDNTNKRLGIGIATPPRQLSVYGAGSNDLNDTSNLTASIFVASTTNGSNYGGGIYLSTINDNNTYLPQWGIKSLLTNGLSNGVSDFIIAGRATNSATALTERLRITNTGNVLFNNLYGLTGGDIVISNNTGGAANIILATGAGAGTARLTIASGGAATFSNNVSLGTIGSGAGTATPLTLNLGDTFSTTAGSNLKLRLFQDNSANIYGIGVSNNQMDFNVPAGGGYKFFTGAATFNGEIISRTNTTTGIQVQSSTGTQSLWIRAGYDSDGSPTPAVSANNIQFQSSGSNTGSFSFVTGNAKVLSILSVGITSTVSVAASSFIKTGGTAAQFLKADGTVDGNTYYLASNPNGYVTSSDNVNGLNTTFLGTGSTDINSGYNRVIRNENGSGGNYQYAPVLHLAASDTMWQIQGEYSASMNLQWRGGYLGTWNPWRTILHSGNYNSYSPTLTGGGASGTWGISITGNANTATTATSSPLLSALGNYVWTSSDLPTSYSSGLQLSFVGPAVGEGSWQNYGSVLTARTYSGGGGSLQMYVPYGPSNGGDSLQVRFGNYNVSSGNSWTAWKIILQSDNYSSYAIPISGGINMTGSYGLNDNKLYLRGNNDNNHYIWNAADDWEEIVAYSGTGLRIASSTGTTLATFTTSGNSMSQNLTFTNGRKGLIGQYDAQQTQAIFAMGAAYILTDGGASNVYGDFYGLAWSYNPDYGAAGNNPQSKAGLSHQLLIMNAGVTKTALGNGVWTSGNISAANFSGSSSGTNTGDQTNISGNAATANYATSAGNADTVDGFHASQSNIGNYIVVRDGNGYIFGNYVNMTDDGNPGAGTAISSFITKQGDNYYRSVSPTNAMVSIRGVASGSWGINITGSAGSSSSTGAITHNENRTDGTYYPVGWFAGTPSPAYSCANVKIQSSTGTLSATKLATTGFDLNGYAQMYGGDFWFRGVSNDGIRTRCAAFGRMLDQDLRAYSIYTNDNGGDVFEIFSERYSCDVRFNRADSYNKDCFRFYHDGNGSLLQAYQGDGVTLGLQISTFGDSLFAGNVVANYSFSDERLKQNIQTIENPIEKIMQLRGVTYEWNEGYRKDEKDYGLVAQEVQKILPELVKETDRLGSDIKYLNVNYEHIVGLLIEGMKEQQKEIDYLKSKINI